MRSWLALVLLLAFSTIATRAAEPVSPAASSGIDESTRVKMDSLLAQRAADGSQGRSRIIIRTADGRPVPGLVASVAGTTVRPLLGGQVAVVPDAALAWLASQPAVLSISLDRAVRGALSPGRNRTADTVGARWVADELGIDGFGVGIATIDSGISEWHADIAGRVAKFVDFVNARPMPYDDYGHGTHVAGIIGGDGFDSAGVRRGVAPGASLIVLKALDEAGAGYASSVIAAIDYAIANRAPLNIRVINLSVAAAVYESYHTDPLALAAKRAVDAGIVVVAAAGNDGKDARGRARSGGIASPGNAPWVLTVGASNEMGTAERRDDIVAPFSSRGPSPIDRGTKPDLVAPGVDVASTAALTSALFLDHPAARVRGALDGADTYMSLTGTSMAAPVVAGTVALLLQANPALTPNAVKAILQYTAEARQGYGAFDQGAGFLNARGAVHLARTFAGLDLEQADPTPWSRHIIWGNRLLSGGVLDAAASAWQPGLTWGASRTRGGGRVRWGTLACTETSCTPWATACRAKDKDPDCADAPPAIKEPPPR